MNRVSNKVHSKYAPLLLVISIALLFLAFWIARYSSTWLGHDQVLLLMDAQGFLGGYTIYGPHLSETNPPLMIWFSTIPVMLSHHLSASPMFWFRVVVFVLICVSTVWSVRLLQRSGKVPNGFGLALYGLIVLGTELNIGGYDFGQREHVLVLFLLPYLLGVATGAVEQLSLVERCLLGVAAGCAIWFKPQDVLIVIGVEIACAISARTVRRIVSAEFISMFLTACFLLMCVCLFTPLYMRQVVPLLVDVYWALGTSTFSAVLLASHRYIATFLLAVLFYLALRRRLVDKTTPLVLLAGSAAAFVAYGVQHTKWNYHQYPHRTLVLLAALYMLVDVLHPLWTKIGDSRFVADPVVFALSGCALLFAGILAFHPALVRKRAEITGSVALNSFLDQVAPGTTVSALSTSVFVMAATYDHGLKWGSRFAHLWLVPALIQNEMGRTSPSTPFKQLSPETMLRLSTLQRQEVAEDLSYWHPDVVLVSICTRDSDCQGIQGKDVDLVAWFERSPQFAEAWSKYVRQPGIEGFDVYRLTH